MTNTPVKDASDYANLWTDTGIGDGLTSNHLTTVAIGKPKDFFRKVPTDGYSRRTEIYINKVDGVIEETPYIIAPPLHGRIIEAKPCWLHTVVDRNGTPRLWPIMNPREGDRDNEAWISARTAARVSIDRLVKIIWVSRSYTMREALEGYAPDPDFTKLPPFDELVQLAFGAHGVIRDTAHPMYRALFGMPKSVDADA